MSISLVLKKTINGNRNTWISYVPLHTAYEL